MHDSPAPSGWVQRRLLEVVDLPSGQVDPKQEPYRSQVLVAPDHVEGRTGRLLAKSTAAEQRAISGKYPFGPGDVIYSKIRPYLRKAVLADFEGLCSADMYPLRPREDVEPRFLLALILGEHFSRFAEIVSMRSGFPKINRNELGEYVASLPQPEEQRRIAEILDTVDEAIRSTEAVIRKLEQVKRGLLHDLLTRGIDDNGELRDPERHPEQFKDSPLGRIPRAWDYGPLERWLCLPPKNGYSPKEVDERTGTVMLGLGCLTQSGFKPRQLKNAPRNDANLRKALLKEGDLLISRSNTPLLVGLVGVYESVGLPCIYPDLMMRLRLVDGVETRFMELTLRSHPVRRQIQAVATGTSGSMVKINAAKVKALRVPMPPPEERDHILARMKRVQTLISGENEEADKLRLLKTGLMDDLLTGRVRVPTSDSA